VAGGLHWSPTYPQADWWAMAAGERAAAPHTDYTGQVVNSLVPAWLSGSRPSLLTAHAASSSGGFSWSGGGGCVLIDDEGVR